MGFSGGDLDAFLADVGRAVAAAMGAAPPHAAEPCGGIGAEERETEEETCR